MMSPHSRAGDPTIQQCTIQQWMMSPYPRILACVTTITTAWPDNTPCLNMDQCVDNTDPAPPDHVTSQGIKPHSTPLTLKWLDENYQVAGGVCIPRCTLYVHYRSFCQLNNTTPVNAASFGKIIRQQFPEISTRRLGTRGQSKYHYYGIGVRGSTSYMTLTYPVKSFLPQSDVRKGPHSQVVTQPRRSIVDDPLLKFPNINIIRLPADVDTHKVASFMAMYQAHCQQILDVVLRVSRQEVSRQELVSCVFDFWQGMPADILSLLHQSIIVTMVGVCDSILYKTLADVLMPTAVHTLPDSSSHMTLNFAQELETGLSRALWGLPHSLQRIKLESARWFTQIIRRLTSLRHLMFATRSVLTTPEMVSQLLTDWRNVDINSVVKQAVCTMEHYGDREHSLVLNLCSDFERLLGEQAQLETYLCWLENLVHCCVLKVSHKRGQSLRSRARQFLLVWSCVGTRLAREMTLHNAPSFGSFHLLHLLFDDYVLFLMESQDGEHRASQLMAVLRGEKQKEDLADDVMLPDPAPVKDFFTSTWRSDEGHTRCEKMADQSSIGDLIMLDDNDVIDQHSDDEDGELTDDDSPGLQGDDMCTDVNTSRVQSLYSYTSLQQQHDHQQQLQQHHQVLQLQQLEHIQHNYRDQAVMTSASSLHHSGSLPHPQANRPCNYLVSRYCNNSQSSWTVQSHVREETMSGRNLPIPSQHASFSQDPIYQSQSLRLPMHGGTMSQFPPQFGKSCQQNLPAFTSVNHHGYMSVSPEVMSSFLTDNSSMKQKHSGGPEEDPRLQHSQLLKRPRHQDDAAPQHCGMELL